MSDFKTSELRDTSQELQELRKQLAASQLREQQLRAALETCLDGFEFTRQYVGADKLPAIAGWSWFDAVSTANSALSMPPDTAALEAMIQKAGEVMRERCVYAADNPVWETEDEIRDLPGVKLEDLK